MNFSKTTEYALRILSHMTMDTDRLYRADDMYEALEIPFRYLRKLLTTLSKNGLLISVQGKGGGYKIAGDLSKIYLIDIVKAIDEKQPKRLCFFGYENCTLENKCAMHDKWIEINNNIDSVLKTMSLENLHEFEIHSLN